MRTAIHGFFEFHREMGGMLEIQWTLCCRLNGDQDHHI